MFPGRAVDRSHWDHIEASTHPRVHVRCVFIMFSVCIWAKKHSWDLWGCFLFPLRLLVSPQLLLSVGGVVSLPVSSTPLTGELPAERQLWDRFHSHVFAPLFLLPPSLFPTLPSHFPRSSVLGFPHLQHIRVFTLQLYSRESS